MLKKGRVKASGLEPTIFQLWVRSLTALKESLHQQFSYWHILNFG